MKNFSVTGLILLVLLLANGAQAQYFNGPESLTYDTLNSRYLISNVLTGDIVQISDAGDTTFFDRSLARTLGMKIVDSILYVADISGLITFNLITDQRITTITIPGMLELNDVTADTSGFLYITDVGADKIYRVRISDHSDTTIVSGIDKPNGILFDARNNRVLFCQFVYNAPIKEIDLNDLSVTTVLATSFHNLDGLAIDDNGNIYVSSWGNHSVYRYDNMFSQPAELVSSGHHGPADIYYNQRDNILAIPNFYSDHVDFLPVDPTDVDVDINRSSQGFTLFQNYPNPFNPTTIIEFQIPEFSFVTLKIYDLLGSEIAILVNENKSVGKYKVEWDARGLPSGIYFCRINAGDFAETKKMILKR